MSRLAAFLLLSAAVSVAQAADVTVTRDPSTIAACTVVGQVASTFGHWGFTGGGERQVKARAALLGADTVLITSSRATDWLTSGVAYRCAK